MSPWEHRCCHHSWTSLLNTKQPCHAMKGHCPNHLLGWIWHMNGIYECSIMQLWLLNVLALTIHHVHDESNWQYQCYHLKEVIFIKLFWCVDSSNNYFYIFKLVVHLVLSITFFTGIDVWYFSTFLHYMIMMTANIHYIRSYKIQPVRWKETMHLYCSREAYHS